MRKDKTIVWEWKRKKDREWIKGKTVRCREIIGLSGTRAWREASNACVCVCVCVCVSHERVLFSDKYIVLISVCGDHSLCMLSLWDPGRVWPCVCVCMWPIVRWQSHRASCRYALSHRVHLIHQRTHAQACAHTHAHIRTHTHTYTHQEGLCWDREHRGEREMRRGREVGWRLGLRVYYHTTENELFLFFLSTYKHF